jgi:hypothetical protein
VNDLSHALIGRDLPGAFNLLTEILGCDARPQNHAILQRITARDPVSEYRIDTTGGWLASCGSKRPRRETEGGQNGEEIAASESGHANPIKKAIGTVSLTANGAAGKEASGKSELVAVGTVSLTANEATGKEASGKSDLVAVGTVSLRQMKPPAEKPPANQNLSPLASWLRSV